MKKIHSDLFPETLLVSLEGGRIFTTSVRMAEYFGKRHDNVMKAIYKAIKETPDDERLLNFKERLEPYMVNNALRQRRIFDLTHDGFMFVAQGFTGKEANAWKWKFIAAFRDMERQLHALKEREANALYRLRPAWKPILLHPNMRRGELIELTGHKSPGSITACRRKMRHVGLLEAIS